MNNQQSPSSVSGLRKKAWHFMSSYYPVILAFLLHHALVVVASLAYDRLVFKPENLVRFDSYLYIDIAKKGYELFPCHERFETYAATSTEWCGNTGWMPLYPLCMKGLMSLGMHEYVAGYWLSKLFFLGTLLLLFAVLKDRDKITRNLGLLLAAIFPSSVYYAAVFPISMMLMLVLGCFYFWKQQKYVYANILAFLVPLSYSTGFVCAAPWALFTLALVRRKSVLWRHSFPVACSILLGYLCFFIIQKWSTGHWDAFFLIQTKYGHGFHNVPESIWMMCKSIWLSGLNNNWRNIQSLIFIGLIPFVIYCSFRERRLPVLFFNLYVIAYAMFPLIIGSNNLAQFRAEALLLPLVICLSEHRKLAVILIPVFLYLSICCAMDFFLSRIV